MNIIENPSKDRWSEICERPLMNTEFLRSSVGNILDRVNRSGDSALKEFTARFDKVNVEKFEITKEEMQSAADGLDPDLRNAIDSAAENIRKFHLAQVPGSIEVETMPGVVCRRKPVAIQNVGIYVPGGTAPLFSSVLMMTIPAKLAGCRNIVLCSPPGADGSIHPAILYSALSTGVDRVFRVGGAQAVAAMAFGTESIPRVDKIYGPGNQFVTLAKQLAREHGVAIDMPAGPSELAVLADETAIPSYVASDLLSQAEHGPDSQVILVTTDKSLPAKVKEEIDKQVSKLPRARIAREALQHSKIVYMEDLEDAMEIVNFYAPEHLIIQTKHAAADSEGVTNAGSVFIGPYTPESAGDYASGTNHTLPTNGFARAYSGLNTESFMKFITFQEISAEGLKRLGPIVEKMAEAELLEAHRNAIAIRLENE